MAEYQQLVSAISSQGKGVTYKDVIVTDMAATVTVRASTPAALLLLGIKVEREVPAVGRSAVPDPAADTGKEVAV